MCKWLADAKLEGDSSVDTVFYRAEGMRLFECKDSAFTSSVRDEIQKILANPGSSLNSVNDFYQANILNSQAQKYGLSKNDGFEVVITEKVAKWADSFTLETGVKGSN